MANHFRNRSFALRVAGFTSQEANEISDRICPESVINTQEAVTAYSERQLAGFSWRAHEVCVSILGEIAAFLRPGVTEAEVREAAEGVFVRHGVEKQWHRPYVYFGKHTVLTAYDAKPKDEILTLGEEDIAYIDIGPVIRIEGLEIEADLGRTFVFGDNPEHHAIKQAAEAVFEDACAFWKSHQPTGVELYQHVYRLSKQAGFIFNLDPPGHLIGSFPHTGWKTGLHTYPHQLEPGLWILEIQLCHPTKPFGAFHEAVLL